MQFIHCQSNIESSLSKGYIDPADDKWYIYVQSKLHSVNA